MSKASKKRYWEQRYPNQPQSKQLAAPVAQKPGRYGKKPPLTLPTGETKTEIDYFHFYESLYRKEITDWQSARALRRDPFNPISYPLQQLYKDSMLDNHLRGAINNRILKTLNKDFFLRDSEGNIDPDRSAQIQTRWFRTIVRRALESKFYGYSLLYAGDLATPGRQLIDMPRENVIPEKGVVVKNAFDPNSQGIRYGDFPRYFIYIQLGDDPIGELERIAPLTIYKRHSWASWDQFEQIFGLPIRIARTMINTPKHRDDLQMWLETMGTASYAIFDKQVDVELKENQRTDAYKVFYEKVRALNHEISKGINGQTMTMDDGSSQSQATVHLDIQNEIVAADIQDVQDWATDELFPVLRMHGFDIPEGYFLSVVEREEMNPSEKIKIDSVLLLNGYNIKPEYIEEFYGTPLDEEEPRREVMPPTMLSAPKELDSSLKDFFF